MGLNSGQDSGHLLVQVHKKLGNMATKEPAYRPDGMWNEVAKRILDKCRQTDHAIFTAPTVEEEMMEVVQIISKEPVRNRREEQIVPFVQRQEEDIMKAMQFLPQELGRIARRSRSWNCPFSCFRRDL